MKKMALPKTDSMEELAAYWDTHDLIDHEEELEEIENLFWETDSDPNSIGLEAGR